jgi:hypothetical protein
MGGVYRSLFLREDERQDEAEDQEWRGLLGKNNQSFMYIYILLNSLYLRNKILYVGSF